jgi:hypothetical protein
MMGVLKFSGCRRGSWKCCGDTLIIVNMVVITQGDLMGVIAGMTSSYGVLCRAKSV